MNYFEVSSNKYLHDSEDRRTQSVGYWSGCYCLEYCRRNSGTSNFWELFFHGSQDNFGLVRNRARSFLMLQEMPRLDCFFNFEQVKPRVISFISTGLYRMNAGKLAHRDILNAIPTECSYPRCQNDHHGHRKRAMSPKRNGGPCESATAEAYFDKPVCSSCFRSVTPLVSNATCMKPQRR